MHPRRAFTLLELLTVIAVIGVLAGILIPVTGAVRNKACATQCLSNMRQVGAASLLYVNDHKGRLPSSSHDRAPDGSSRSWRETLRDYLGPDFIGRCPSRPDHIADTTYSWNELLTEPPGPNTGRGIPLNTCRQPSATLMLAERLDDEPSDHLHFRQYPRGVTPAAFRQNVRLDVHGGANANYLFTDGHVENLPATVVDKRLTASGSRFITP